MPPLPPVRAHTLPECGQLLAATVFPVSVRRAPVCPRFATARTPPPTHPVFLDMFRRPRARWQGWHEWSDLPAPYKYYDVKVDPKDVEQPGFLWNVFTNWRTGLPVATLLALPAFVFDVRAVPPLPLSLDGSAACRACAPRRVRLVRDAVPSCASTRPPLA
jgi:hypothetical protein